MPMPVLADLDGNDAGTDVDTRPLIRRIVIYIAGAVYVGALLLVMRLYIQQPFAYLGYVVRNPSAVESVAAVCVTALLLTLTPTIWLQPSHTAYAFLVAVVALPSVWVPLIYGPLNAAKLSTLYGAVALSFALLRWCLAGERKPLTLVAVPPRLFWAAIIIVTVLGIGYLLVVTGLRPSLLTFSEVYDQRSQYNAAMKGGGQYVVGGLANGVFAMTLASGLERRSTFLRLLGLFSILVVYSITGFKSYALGAAMAIGVFVLIKIFRNRGHIWLTALAFTVVVSGLMEYLTGSIGVVSIFVRRALSTPGLNTAYYIDFFFGQSKYELRNSILGFIGESPYPLGAPQVIGLHYYGDPVSANANLLADGYANFGFIGCLVAAIIVGLFLRYYDRLASGLSLAAGSAALVPVLLSFANSAPLTVLATHGGIVLAVAVSSVPRTVGANELVASDRRPARSIARERRHSQLSA